MVHDELDSVADEIIPFLLPSARLVGRLKPLSQGSVVTLWDLAHQKCLAYLCSNTVGVNHITELLRYCAELAQSSSARNGSPHVGILIKILAKRFEDDFIRMLPFLSVPVHAYILQLADKGDRELVLMKEVHIPAPYPEVSRAGEERLRTNPDLQRNLSHRELMEFEQLEMDVKKLAGSP